ncbi:MAG: HAD family hydrolase [Pirellulaceae bacterium]
MSDLSPSPSDMASPVEIVSASYPRGDFRAAIFDFDGTLSVLRRNWQDVMIPMMVDILQNTGTPETRESLFQHVEEYVMRLNGKQTIYQMIQLAEEVRARGGTPREPLEYKHQYHDLLWQQVGDRVEGVRSGRIARQEMAVPGAEEMLQALLDLGLELYLASGTDVKYVRDELHVLGLERFFKSHVYGALDDYKKFSKAMIIAQIISDTRVRGNQILGMGDGFVEIEEVKKVGGLAVGVASNEDTRSGVNDWKRQRLIRAGADIIIGDYRCRPELLRVVGLSQQPMPGN